MALVEVRLVNPARAAGYGANLWLRKGHSVTELTLSAESVGRQLQPVPMPQRDGAFNKTGGKCSASRRLPLPREATRCATENGKVLYLLIFMPWRAGADFSISAGETRPFPRHTFAQQFFRTFSVLLQTYPYWGCSTAAYCCVPYLRGMKTPQGNFILLNHLSW
jgi:hypothetical protein